MKIKVNEQKISIDKVKPNDWNYNIQNSFMFEKEKQSISEDGFVVPIVVREKDGFYEIIDGEHRWKACIELGMKEISINNLGTLSDKEAKRLSIRLNETKGYADNDVLKDLLVELEKEYEVDIREELPFSDNELDEIINTKEDNFAFDSKENTIICPKCGHKFSN